MQRIHTHCWAPLCLRAYAVWVWTGTTRDMSAGGVTHRRRRRVRGTTWPRGQCTDWRTGKQKTKQTNKPDLRAGRHPPRVAVDPHTGRWGGVTGRPSRSLGDTAGPIPSGIASPALPGEVGARSSLYRRGLKRAKFALELRDDLNDGFFKT